MKYHVGFTGAFLWLLSWAGLFSFWPNMWWFGRVVSSGGVFMLLSGGLGYLLLFVSAFLKND